MNKKHKRRLGFTLTELLILLAITGLSGASSISFIQEAREEARRTQCSNNLRQLGIAVHNYADVNGEQFVPVSSDFAHWSWVYFLLPMMEGSATYDHIRHDRWAGDTRDTGLLGGTHPEVVAKFRAPALLCPTRHTSTSFIFDAWWVDGHAQSTDYAAVVTGSGTGFAGTDASGCIIWRTQPANVDEGLPLRSATTFGSCIDGLSNTAIIGEKHLRALEVNIAPHEQPALIGGSGGYLRLFHGRILGGNPTQHDAPRAPHEFGLNRGLSRHPNDEPGNAAGAIPLAIVDEWSFGSWHPGICQFLMGDASVRSVSNETDTHVLSILGGRNDLSVLELPEE